MALKKLAILGSTGSIGKSTLEIVAKNNKQFKVVALSCYTKIDLLIEQIIQFKPKAISVPKNKIDKKLSNTCKQYKVKIFTGKKGLIKLSKSKNNDLVVAGIVGAAGLEPVYHALKSGCNVALANKEPLVMAGELMVDTAKKNNSLILPTDSEHNAIFQVLQGHNNLNKKPLNKMVKKIVLTGSGGPFLNTDLKDFKNITLEKALKHPNWLMGPKITIDSATMMNKGLEVIEAKWLFDVPNNKIEVIVHPQSIIHSMVHYVDGSYLAQLGQPDMRIPISYCLGYPNRVKLKDLNLKFTELKPLTFKNPDFVKFPCLKLAFTVLNIGGSAPCALNAANEIAVDHFLKNQIEFNQIYPVIAYVMDEYQLEMSLKIKTTLPKNIKSIAQALKVDLWARDRASKFIKTL